MSSYLDDVGWKALLIFASALVSAVGIEAWRRWTATRRDQKVERWRWRNRLLYPWFGAHLLLFLVTFPPFVVTVLLYAGALSWSQMGILFGLPLGLVLMLLALRPEKRTRGLTLTLSLTGCLTLVLPLVLCPVILVIVALLLGSTFGQTPDLDQLVWGSIPRGEVALLLVAVVACAVLLFVGAKRAGKPGPPRSDGEE